ncbi:class I SAM-dependent methyltransferase [Aspergillus foveolatus]|uniref:class I SAM-dependent methyltransferase n=1 Tax=Aspergillus foveolatus TaxID=210207 RepID=UPI003CCE3FE8
MSEAAEIYPLGRDEAESRRLNEQHKLLIDFTEGLIDRSVPLEKITAVADVATGTGIWLWDARKLLVDRAGESPRYFHGFDISPVQFPSAAEGIDFTVHDIFKPFPVEHRNRYDLVNVRLLVSAITESDYEKAVQNLITILKPGGYLQWGDMDFSATATDDPRVATACDLWLKYCRINNLSQCAPIAIQKAYQDAGLLNIVNRAFLPSKRGDLLERLQNWQMKFYKSVLHLALLKTGQAADQVAANQMAPELLRGLELFYAEGNTVDSRFNVVVGQKPT